MKLAVIGSREFNNWELLNEKVSQLKPTLIVSGGARGADTLGERYADENNIEKLIFPADWRKFGKSAGYIRNKNIIESCDEVIAFWDGKSRGTMHSINIAKESGKKVHLVRFTENI